MNPRHRFALVIFVFSVPLFQSCELQAQIRSNLRIFTAQADSFVTTALEIVKSKNVGVISIKFDSTETGNFIKQKFLERALIEHLTIMSDGYADTAVLAAISVPLMAVSYSSPVASHLFGSSEVVRTVRSSYSLNLLRNSKFIFARTFSYETSDTVPDAEIRSLEVGEYNFVHGSILSKSIFNDVIQPLLFAGAAAVVVYLFFVLRGG
ncbi:MAG: hypothetical protein ACP5US_02450 [Candidatus Kryptoniota bacterium]